MIHATILEVCECIHIAPHLECTPLERYTDRSSNGGASQPVLLLVALNDISQARPFKTPHLHGVVKDRSRWRTEN